MPHWCSVPRAVNELAPIGLLLIVLSAVAFLTFVAARRVGDRGAAQLAAAVIMAILLVLIGFVVAAAYFAPFD
jgi:hypothetical protein